MPNWKKVIVSGSDASLNSLEVTTGVNSPTFTGNLTGTASNVTGTVAIGNGGTGATTAAAARTNLGATTVGANLFTLTNPGAIRFLRVNAANTVDALTAADFRTAIGAGTSSTINATNTTDATEYFPTFVASTGTDQTARATSTTGNTAQPFLSYNPSGGTLSVGNPNNNARIGFKVYDTFPQNVVTHFLQAQNGSTDADITINLPGAAGTLGVERVAGNTGVGFLKYNSTNSQAGALYGGTTNPTGTTRVNYNGRLAVGQLSVHSTTSTAGTFYSGTTNPTGTTRVNYNGFFATGQIAVFSTTRTAGTFYSGTTAPTSTNRTNYDGEFRATRFGVGASLGLTDNIVFYDATGNEHSVDINGGIIVDWQIN